MRLKCGKAEFPVLEVYITVNTDYTEYKAMTKLNIR